MHKIVPIIAFLGLLTACNTQRSQIINSTDESEETTFFDAHSARLDTSNLQLSADLDSPEFIVIHADSTQLHIRARRLHVNSHRSNGVSQTSQVHTDSTARTSSNANVNEQHSTESMPDWMEWLAYIAIIAYIVNRIRTKLANKN